MKKYSLYLFDFDGTLFDTAEALKDCYDIVFKKYGVTPGENEYLDFIMISLPRAILSKGVDKKHVSDFCKAFNEAVISEKVIKLTKTYPDTLKFIRYLERNKIKYGIVTGSSVERVKDVYRYFKLDFKKMAVCVGNDSYKRSKPEPDPILIALKKVNYLKRKNEVLYVGDAKQDKDCALAAGVDYLNIKRQHNKKGDIKSLFDLFKYL